MFINVFFVPAPLLTIGLKFLFEELTNIIFVLYNSTEIIFMLGRVRKSICNLSRSVLFLSYLKTVLLLLIFTLFFFLLP